MNTVLELRQRRASLWEQAKKFLDEAPRTDGILSADDTAAYEKMERDIVALGKEIDIQERREELEKNLNAPVNTPITNPVQHLEPEKTGRASAEYKKSFWSAMRNKRSYEVQNALEAGEDSEGGYLVPEEFEATLIDKLTEENVIRTLATIIPSSGDKKIPVVASHGAASWTDEEAEYIESDDAFGNILLGSHKLTTIIKISEELLNDAAFNMESYIAAEFARRMAAAEEAAFLAGDGSGKPTGLLNMGETGVTSAAAAALTADELIDLYHSLRTPYRQKAVFITNDNTVKAIRKLKDGTGQYMWQPGLQAGQPDTLLNRPLITSAFMPEFAAGNKVMAFGDLSYYWIADRQGRSFQRLNELFAKNGQVGFRTFQRVDGKLTLAEAVKALEMKA